MGLLRRLFGGRAAPRWPPGFGPITAWPVGEQFDGELDATIFEPRGRARLEVVGESAYQGTLELLGAGRTIDGVRQRHHLAVLLPEPDNPYDPNAVRVLVVPAGGRRTWGKVGYLARAEAVGYRAVIDRLAEMGKVVACRAALKGGWIRDRQAASIGISLRLGSPAELMAEIDRDHGPDPRWPSEPIVDRQPYDRVDCPYCGVALDPLPKAKKRCPSCSQPIYVRGAPDGVRYLLREADLEAHEARWEEHFGARDVDRAAAIRGNARDQSRRGLLDYARLGVHQVELLVADDACAACRMLGSRPLRLDAAPELPVPGCSNEICRCDYVPVVD